MTPPAIKDDGHFKTVDELSKSSLWFWQHDSKKDDFVKQLLALTLS